MMTKKKQITCKCPAYPFPHRQGGGKCKLPEACDFQDELNCANCFYDWDCIYLQKVLEFADNYDPREEALTIQERNSNFRSW